MKPLTWMFHSTSHAKQHILRPARVSKYSLLLRLIPLVVLVLVASGTTAQANRYTMDAAEELRTFEGTIANAESQEVIIVLENVQAGDTLYILAQGFDTVSPYLFTTGPGLSRAFADETQGDARSATLTHTVEADGTVLVRMVSEEGTGDFRITVGINRPDALLNDMMSDPAQVSSSFVLSERGTVAEFSGEFADPQEEILVDIQGVQAGDVIYVYASGVGEVDTYIYLQSADMREVFAEDDDSGGGFNSALSFEIPEDGDYSLGLITISSAGAYRLFIGINTPEVLDASQRADAERLPEGFDEFDCSSIDTAAAEAERPALSGPERFYEGDTFRVHYTLGGRDATTEEYIAVLAEALQRSLDIQFNDLGWALPPADCGEGGDNRLDIYVLDLADVGALGIASPEILVGDNPNTPVREFYAAYSYLMIENDMDGTQGDPFDRVRETAAHEVHHNIQFGYDTNDTFFGFYEAGASWVETLVYPTIADVSFTAAEVFERPDVCIGYMEGGMRFDLRIYGEWLLIDSFARDLGLESYQFIWEYMAANEGLNGFYRGLSELGTSPQEIIERMAVRNLLWDYALAKRFDTTVRLEGSISGPGLISPERNGVQQLSVDYVEITEAGQYTFELLGDETLVLFVVGIEGDRARLYDLGRSGTVDTTQYDHAYAFVLNTAQHSDIDECEAADWTLRVFDGVEDSPSSPDDEIWNASEFVAPD